MYIETYFSSLSCAVALRVFNSFSPFGNEFLSALTSKFLFAYFIYSTGIEIEYFRAKCSKLCNILDVLSNVICLTAGVYTKHSSNLQKHQCSVEDASYSKFLKSNLVYFVFIHWLDWTPFKNTISIFLIYILLI